MRLRNAMSALQVCFKNPDGRALRVRLLNAMSALQVCFKKPDGGALRVRLRSAMSALRVCLKNPDGEHCVCVYLMQCQHCKYA